MIDGVLILNISDNGKGFEIETSAGRHLAERCALIHGECRIESKGEGTIIQVIVPLISEGE